MAFLGKEHIVDPFVTAFDAGFEIDGDARRAKTGKAIDAVFLGDYAKEGIPEMNPSFGDIAYLAGSRLLLRAPSALIGALIGNVGCAVLRAPFQGSDY